MLLYLVILASLVRRVEILFGVTFLWVFEFQAGTISSFVFIRNFKEGGSGVKTAQLDGISLCFFVSLRSLSLIYTHLFLSFLVRGICAFLCLYSKVLLAGLKFVKKFSHIGLIVHQFVCCCKHKHSEPA